MNTPKEKAQELVNTYRMILMDEDTDCGNELLCTSIAIKNALVAVDEIIKHTDELARQVFKYSRIVHTYWNDVKQEIEKI